MGETDNKVNAARIITALTVDEGADLTGQQMVQRRILDNEVKGAVGKANSALEKMAQQKQKAGEAKAEVAAAVDAALQSKGLKPKA